MKFDAVATENYAVDCPTRLRSGSDWFHFEVPKYELLIVIPFTRPGFVTGSAHAFDLSYSNPLQTPNVLILSHLGGQ
eukprot:jgi/Psemu1/301119/fgenesh1_kg.26_\